MNIQKPARSCAYVLITVETGKAYLVLRKLSVIKGLRHAHMVTGPFDIIAFVTADEPGSPASLVVSEIHKIRGVSRTMTCIAFTEVSGGIDSD